MGKIQNKNIFTNFYSNIIVYRNEMYEIKKNNPILFNFWRLLKYLPLWLLKLNSKPLFEKKPWIPFDSYFFLKKAVKKNMIVFEYGSGGSTLFFSKMSGQVISVEHDKDWYLLVKKEIEINKYKNCKLILKEPTIFKEKNNYDTSDLDSYKSSDEKYINMSFENYVKTIDLYPNSHFDIIFIDGRSRPSCVKHAVDKLKVNGYLILDNSDIEVYKKIYEYLGNKHWKKLDFIGPGPIAQGFWQMTSWEKID